MTPALVAANAVIEIPTAIAICPICRAPLQPAEIDEWEESDDGTWQVSDSGVHIQCSTEPDMQSRDWWPWFRYHWQHPYMDWMPLEAKVTEWLQENYRFDMPAVRHA